MLAKMLREQETSDSEILIVTSRQTTAILLRLVQRRLGGRGAVRSVSGKLGTECLVEYVWLGIPVHICVLECFTGPINEELGWRSATGFIMIPETSCHQWAKLLLWTLDSEPCGAPKIEAGCKAVGRVVHNFLFLVLTRPYGVQSLYVGFLLPGLLPGVARPLELLRKK